MINQSTKGKSVQIQFLGATNTVTGSRYLISNSNTKLLVDCGLFQGFKGLRLKNWAPFPIPPEEVDAILLTHAHIDHSGYIPLLVKNGFRGKIFCTKATFELCSILLPDCGFLQEEEARFANKHGFSKHHPALPLYTKEDAQESLNSLSIVDWKKRNVISKSDSEDIFFELHPAGHLFGAASIVVESKGKRIAFSGDLGRKNDPLTRLPDFNAEIDELVVESTYGNRYHLNTDPKEALKEVINKTYKRNGTLIIPSFAVGRAQLLLYYIYLLKKESAIPNIPVYLNSPMAIQANHVFFQNFNESKVSAQEAKAICETATPIRTVDESIELNNNKKPMILIAASGMATGGRVLHHLKAFAPNANNTILFVGYQAGGTRGARIVNGEKEIKIHGEYWPVRAEIVQFDSMSAHADATEILDWIKNIKNKPKRIFITHGEPTAADELRQKISEQIRTEAIVPDYGQIFKI